MKILICPNDFKGSLTAFQASQAMLEGIRQIQPDITTEQFPLTNGGYGSLDIVHKQFETTRINRVIRGPLGDKVFADYLTYQDPDTGIKTAYIEMAQAAGLHLLPSRRRNPMLTTTYGVGELITDAVNKNHKHIIVGMAGGATNDGGMGMAQALGVEFLDQSGSEIQHRKRQGYSGGSLKHLKNISMVFFNQKLFDVKFTIASNTECLLTGRNGTSSLFGPQKGAALNSIIELDANLSNYAAILRRYFGHDVSTQPGSGAGGGLATGMMQFLNAEIQSGTEFMTKTLSFEDKVKKADLIITGEGKIDFHSLYNKTTKKVIKTAKKHQIPIFTFGGTVQQQHGELNQLNVDCIIDVSEGKKITKSLLQNKAYELLKDSVIKHLKPYLN